MKRKQPSKQESSTPTPLSTTALTEEQLQQVTGGLTPQPLPPARHDVVIGYPPGEPWKKSKAR